MVSWINTAAYTDQIDHPGFHFNAISFSCCSSVILWFSIYPITFLPPTESRNLGRRGEVLSCISLQKGSSFFFKTNFQIPFPSCSFFPQLVFESRPSAASFTHCIEVPLSVLLDNGNSSMKNSSSRVYFSNYLSSLIIATVPYHYLSRSTSPVCKTSDWFITSQITAHICPALCAKYFQECVRETKLYVSYTQELIKISPFHKYWATRSV